MDRDIIQKRIQRQQEYYAVDTLARTVWGEARGEGVQGMHAVACVVMNRLKISKQNKNYWWGNTIIDICKKPYQFSCWNHNDANFQKIQTITIQDRHFATAKRIAGRIIRGQEYDDITNGADHYHTECIRPKWRNVNKITAHIGTHIFYKLGDIS